MEVVTSAAEKVKGFFDNIVHGCEKSYSRNPIEILKRLHRESFSDLMKQRDRLDKVERVLSFYKTSNGSPFQEASSHVKGEVDVLGAVLMVDNIESHHVDALDRAGVRTGIHTRITIETTLRQNDTLVVDLMTNHVGSKNIGDNSGSPFSLSKLSYAANIGDWFSAIAIPLGAQCRDFDIARNNSHKGKSLTAISFFDPPILNQHNGGAIGLMVRKSNVVASLAQSVSGLGMQLGSNGIGHCLATFGQVACQLSRRVNLSLMGLHQVPRSLSQHVQLGPLAIPSGFLKLYKASESTTGATASPPWINSQEMASTRSIALQLETEFDESMRIGGWIEMQNSNPKLRWAITLSDILTEDLGWALIFSGMRDGPIGWNQYQLESFLDICLDKRFSLKLGTAYVVDGDARIPALMVRCNWSL